MITVGYFGWWVEEEMGGERALSFSQLRHPSQRDRQPRRSPPQTAPLRRIVEGALPSCGGLKNRNSALNSELLRKNSKLNHIQIARLLYASFHGLCFFKRSFCLINFLEFSL